MRIGGMDTALGKESTESLEYVKLFFTYGSHSGAHSSSECVPLYI